MTTAFEKGEGGGGGGGKGYGAHRPVYIADEEVDRRLWRRGRLVLPGGEFLEAVNGFGAGWSFRSACMDGSGTVGRVFSI